MTDTAVAATPGRGGAAAIYGFLYQLLASSARLIEAMVDQFGSSEPDTVTAVLEPAVGGDLEILATGRTCIQLKYRSTALDSGELIDSVFADLFIAHCAVPADRYELQPSGGRKRNGPARPSGWAYHPASRRPASRWFSRICGRSGRSCVRDSLESELAYR